MILTITPNPSIDTTLRLTAELNPGRVHRAIEVNRVAGGKGINVSHAVHLAGQPTKALFPAHPADPFMPLISAAGFPFRNVSMKSSVRINTTLNEPNGRTTKANGPGPVLASSVQEEIVEQLTTLIADAHWVVFAGSLPGGVPDDWYSTLTQVAREANPDAQIAIDTSDKFLQALRPNLATTRPNLITPNGMELGQLIGVDGHELEDMAKNDDYHAVIDAAQMVNTWGIPAVLVTLGSAGAVLVTSHGVWKASAPITEVKSTVGAGDCALAGFLLARTAGQDFPTALQTAVAYGSAASALPGTQIPGPELIDKSRTVVTEL